MIGLSLILIYTPKAYKHRFDTIFAGKEIVGHSKEHRIRMYGRGWEIFKKYPFGVGVGNFPLAHFKYYHSHQEMHCLYLEVLTHLGIQGFIIFMLLIAKISSVLWQLNKKLKGLIYRAKTRIEWKRQLEELKFLQATIRSLTVYFLLRLFVDLFGMDLYGICWWFVIGIASAATFVTSTIQEQML